MIKCWSIDSVHLDVKEGVCNWNRPGIEAADPRPGSALREKDKWNEGNMVESKLMQAHKRDRQIPTRFRLRSSAENGHCYSAINVCLVLSGGL
eukprot:gene20977-biopygen7061